MHDIDKSVLPRDQAVHPALFRMAGLPESDLERALSVAHMAAGTSAARLKGWVPKGGVVPEAGAENAPAPASAVAEKAPPPVGPHAAAPPKKTANKKTPNKKTPNKKTPNKKTPPASPKKAPPQEEP